MGVSEKTSGVCWSGLESHGLDERRAAAAQLCIFDFTCACLAYQELRLAVYDRPVNAHGLRLRPLTDFGSMMVKALCAYTPDVVFLQRKGNPYFAVMLKAFHDAELEYCLSDLLLICHDMRTVECLGRFMRTLEAGLDHERFQSALSQSRRNEHKNAGSLVAYLEGLYQQYARLLILRIDLGYRVSMEEGGFYEAPDYETANRHRVLLLEWLRGPVWANSLVGYVWKLEYGQDKGWHYHFMLFFRGDRVRADSVIGDRIGRYWCSGVTGKQGTYFNCNHKKHSYSRCGIGMINHHEIERLTYLKEAASYLVKTDYLAHALIPAGARIFGKGQVPKPVGQNMGGRPRVHEGSLAVLQG